MIITIMLKNIKREDLHVDVDELTVSFLLKYFLLIWFFSQPNKIRLFFAKSEFILP